MIQTPFLSSPPTPPVASWRSLTYGIVALAPSLFISRLGWVGMKVTDTALLGHVGTHALAASSLSDLWTMASGVFIQGRVLGIFVGNAVGAAKAGTAPWSVAGEWFQVSVAVLGVIALAVMGLRAGREVSTLLWSKMAITGIIASVGLTMFPFILPSTVNPDSSLTVWDASSSHQTLFIMLVCTLIFMPLILAYTSWVYKVLWGKVTEADVTENADTHY